MNLLHFRCTGVNCTITPAATIPAPVIAGRVKSKFTFKYGKIEIRAQLPRGDWIFPGIIHCYLGALINDQ